MTSRKIGFISGTFNPVTNGHMSLIEQAMSFCDEIVICIADNPSKQITTSSKVREALIRKACVQWFGSAINNILTVVVNRPEDRAYTASIASGLGATMIIRGVRNAADLAYEQELAQHNLAIAPDIPTVVLLTKPAYTHISSSAVRSMVGIAGWRNVVGSMVPVCVMDFLTWQDGTQSMQPTK